MLASLVHPHEVQTEVRMSSYADLFGGPPEQYFAYTDFSHPDDEIRIDVLAYKLKHGVALVTNGLSDAGRPRRELLQYCSHHRRSDAERLHGAAHLAIRTGRQLDYADTLELPHPAGTAWPNAIFLPPQIRSHSDFEITVDGDPLKLLWHLPLSDSELAYKQAHGVSALLEGMSTAKLPWIFDEATRPVLR